MIKYKLTTANLKTFGIFQWEVGRTVKTSGIGGLCSAGFLHYYHHPLLAVLLNSAHGNYNIETMRLWEVEAKGKHLDDDGLKGGCTQMTLLREIPVPVVTTEQHVRFAILCAMEVCKDRAFVDWAQKWLLGIDRSYKAVVAAAWAAEAEAEAGAGVGARAAAWAAARATVRTAEAAQRGMLKVTVHARAAEAATWAARAAPLNLIALAEKAMREE